MLIVVERRETFHYYYPMGVHPPGDLTVTDYRKAREEMQELVKAQKNIELFFAEEKDAQEKQQTR